MKSRDLVTLKLSSDGGADVVADIAKVKKAIIDLRFENEKIADSHARVKGEIAATRTEIRQYGAEISKNEKIVQKAISTNETLQAKMTDLEEAGKTETKQFQNLNDRIDANIKKMQEAQSEIARLTKSRDESKATLERQTAAQKEYKDTLDQNKTKIREYENEEKKINSSLKLNQLSVSQLKVRYAELKKERDAVSQALYPEKWKQLDDQLQAVGKQLELVDKGGKKTNDTFNRMKTTVTKVVTLMAVYAAMRVFQNALREMGDFIKKALEVAAKAEGITTAFRKLNDTKLLGTLRTETKGLVNDVELMKATVKASSFGIPIQNLGNYLKFAQQRAQETGESVDYLVQSIINGIGRKSPLILDNLGISAARLKKEMAGGADIIQATTKIVEEELTKQGTLALTTADKATQASVKWENAQLKLGQRLTWLSGVWSEMSGKIADNISNLIGNVESLSQKYDNQINKVAELEVQTIPLVERYEQLRSKSNLTKQEQIELNQAMNIIAQTIPGVVSEWDKYGNILSVNTQKVYEFIDAEKAKLVYLNRDKIKETTKNIEEYSNKLDDLQAKYKRGYWVEKITNRSIGEVQEVKHPYSPEVLQQMESDIAKYGQLLQGANDTLAEMNGSTIEETVNAQKEMIVKRAEFNGLTKKQLQAWIDNEQNAVSKFIQLARQIYAARFGADIEIDDETESKLLAKQRKELETQLTNQETAHKKELQLLEETRIKERKTDEEHKIEVARSDKKFYDDRVKILENFKKKVTDKKFSADIDKQVVDSTGKSKAQDPIIDKANVDALKKNRDELLKIDQVGTNALKRTQAERNEIAQVSTLREQTIELASAQRKVEIFREYSTQVQGLTIADGREKEQLVRDANDAVIQAETEAIEKRKALDRSYLESNKAIREQYGLVTVNQLQENELSVLEALYNAKLIAEDTYQQSKKAIEQKYNDEKLQTRIEYNIASDQEIYEADLARLKLKLDQELITIEEFEEAKSQLQLDYAIKTAQKINQVTQAAVGMGNALQQAATAQLEAQYQRRIAAAEGNTEEQQRLEEELAQKKLDLEKKYADVQFAIKASNIVANTATAIMMAYSQLGWPMGAIAGALIGVQGALELATANAERRKVKAMTLGGGSGSSGKSSAMVVKGKEEGGYMDVIRAQDGKPFRAKYDPHKRGFIDRPTVLVGEGPAGRSKEFTLSNQGVENPTLRPVIDLIDQEQRKGTIGTVDMNQLLRERILGYQSGGFMGTSNVENSNNSDSERKPSEIEIETLALLKYLKENKIQAKTYIGMSELSAEQKAYHDELNKYSWDKK